MGYVFLAEDGALQRTVALESHEAGSDLQRRTPRERFFAEARAPAHVKHDHVITIHQVGEEQRRAVTSPSDT